MTDGPDASARTRLRCLTGLMAFSVLAIAAHHAALPQVFAGDLGVDVFLLAAGYLISARLLVRRSPREGVLRAFWRERLVAEYPTLLVVVVVFAFAAEHLSGSLSRYLEQCAAVLTFTVNLVASAHRDMGPFLQLWPFAMELQWFVLLSVAVIAQRRWSLRDEALVDVLLGVAVLSLLDEIVTYGGSSSFRPDARVAPLALASALAVARTRHLRGWRSWAPRWPAAASGGILVLACIAWGSVASGTAGALRVPLVTLGAATVVAHVTAPGAAGPVVRLLGPRAFVPATIGAFSTAYYIWHFPMLHLFEGRAIGRAAATVLALVLAAAAAALSTSATTWLASRSGPPERAAVHDRED